MAQKPLLFGESGDRLASRVLVAVLLAAGLAALALRLLPPATLLLDVYALVPGFAGDVFTPDRERRLQLALALTSALFLGGAVACLSLRRRLPGALAHLRRELPRSSKELAADCYRYLRGLPRRSVALLLVILLLATALRLAVLFVPMRYDEAYTQLNFVSRGFGAILSDYRLPNNHVFHSILVRIAYLIFGDRPWALRLPALIPGLLLVPATYLFVRRLYGEGVGLASAALAAVSAPLVLFSTSSRGYSLTALLFVLLILWAEYVRSHANLAAWVLFPLLVSLGAFTVPSMLYPVAVVCMWLVFSVEAPGQTWRTLVGPLALACAAAAALTMALYAPVFVMSGAHALVANPYVRSTPLDAFARAFPRALLDAWHFLNAGFPAPLTAVLALGVLLSIVFVRKLPRRHEPLLSALPRAIVLLLLLQRHHPLPRVWLFLLPLYFAFACAGWDALRRQLVETRSLRTLSPGGSLQNLSPARSLQALSATRFLQGPGLRRAAGLALAAVILLIGVRQVIEHTVTTAPALVREAAGAPEAPAMAASVGALYRPGDVFLSGPPLDVPIMYYTPAAAQRVFVDSPVYARRLLVLVPTPPDDSASIAQYLAGRVPPHYRPTPETPALLLQRFPHGVLYQLLRSRPGPPMRISLP